MIISASRRTDIPAFYSDWFLRRAAQGEVLVRNPMRFHQVSRISLRPQDVDFIAFWTKNPAPLLPRLNELADYDYGFLYTITGYGPVLEPGVPPVAETLRTFRALSERLGPQRVLWRYDPVLSHPMWTVADHRRNFEALARSLAGVTHRCIISFLDAYRTGAGALKRAQVTVPDADMVSAIAPFLAETADRFSMTVEACAEPHDLSRYGIRPGHCIDPTFTGVASGGKDRNQRPGCGCQPSVDIGAYHSCPHRCVYCYANHGEARLSENLRLHDPASPLLVGTLQPEDVVFARKLGSGGQMGGNDGRVSL